MKKIILIIAVAILALGWITVGVDVSGTFIEYRRDIALAEKSVEGELYEQGIEYYYAALKIKDKPAIKRDIKEAYYSFYLQQQNRYSYNRYVSALEDCCNAFGDNSELWDELITLYYNDGSYSDAYDAVNKAIGNGVSTEKILNVRTELSHMYNVSFQNISAYTLGRNSTYSVTDGKISWIMNFSGEKIGIDYKYVGPLDETGKAVFNDNSGSNIRDASQIIRSFISSPVEESGMFNSGLVPVKIGTVWKYINEDGEDSDIGSFDMACSMFDGNGAVKSGDSWQIIDTKGSAITKDKYSEVAFDKFACHTDGNCYIAAVGEEYSVYSASGEKLTALKGVAAVDVGRFSEPFAYKDKGSGLWGYMDCSGNIVIKPAYKEAKGFSNGYAAVADSEGLWGIIEADGSKVTDCEFYSIGYFTPERSCLVAHTAGAIGVFTFAYQFD